MPDIGYLNGRFSPLDEISISPDDRGFLFGDGIYEVIRAYHGVPAFWKEHCTRLVRSAKEIQLPFSIKPQDFHSLLLTGLQQSGYAEGKIYIQLTRGVAPRDHGFPVETEPTVFLSFREMHALPIELTSQGERQFGPNVAELLRRFAPATRINTIGFWPYEEDRKILKMIAAKSGGECVIITKQ